MVYAAVYSDFLVGIGVGMGVLEVFTECVSIAASCMDRTVVNCGWCDPGY